MTAAPVTVYGEAAVHVVTGRRPEGFGLADVEIAVGGPAAVVARQLALLGHRPKLVGVCGKDAAGALVRTELSARGVNCEQLVAIGRTARIVAAVEDGTCGITADPGTSWGDSPWQHFVPTPDGLAYFTAFPDMVPAIRDLGRRGHRLIVDVGFIPLLGNPVALRTHVAAIADAVDVCVLSGADLSDTTRKAVRGICFDGGARVVLTTLAGEGVLVSTPAETVHLQAHTVKVVDAMCAGDSFVAGYVGATLEGRGPIDAARFGQAVAAAKIGLLGRQPTREAVEKLLREAS